MRDSNTNPKQFGNNSILLGEVFSGGLLTPACIYELGNAISLIVTGIVLMENSVVE